MFHDSIIPESAPALKVVSRKPAKTETESGYTPRFTHRVPSTLLPIHRQQIVCEVRAGRSVFDTAHTYSTTTAVVTELWLRNIDKRVTSIGRVA